MRCLLALLYLIAFSLGASAQQSSGTFIGLPIDAQRPSLNINWKIEEVTNGSVPFAVVPDTREPARNGLPDGRVETHEDRRDIKEAWYSEPTQRYRHGVLGDAVEAGALKVRTIRGEVLTYRLARSEVFEDITPRLADLDDDGTLEVITILTSRFEGASVAVFGLNGSALVLKAQSPFIGRSNRWLNVAGTERYIGRRSREIAIVETPHLNGHLKLYVYSPGSTQLRSTMIVPGFSNHQIGSRELRLSASGRLDNNRQPDLVVPSLDRRTLNIVSLSGGTLKLLTRIALPARINRAIGLKGTGREMVLTVGLDDGKIYSLSQQ